MTLQKHISDLPAITSVANGDYMIIEDDPTGTPVTSRITVANFLASGVPFGNTSLAIYDTAGDNTLTLKVGEDLTANATLTIVAGSSRTLTLTGNATLNQDVSSTGSPTFAAITVGNTGLHVQDTDASHDLILAPGSNLTADRTLTLTTGDASRTLTVNGNATLNDWFDQSVKTTGSPSFAKALVGDGSASAPSLAFTADTDTGIYRAATNEVRVATAGADRLTVTADGKFSVGNMSPTYMFEVQSATTTKARFENTGNSNINWYFKAARTGAGQDIAGIDGVWSGTTTVARLSFVTGADTTNKDDGHIDFWTAPAGSLQHRLRITSGGNIGINETSPDYKLDVNGAFGFTPGASVSPVDNGDVVIEATNNTTLTFKLKGSDGVTRSATLTLS